MENGERGPAGPVGGNSEATERERVRGLLRKAFRGVARPAPSGGDARQWYLELRMNLIALEPEEVLEELLGLLEDLLDNHPEDPYETENAEDVVRGLNVMNYRSAGVYELIAGAGGVEVAQAAREIAANVRDIRVEQYALVNREQAGALVEWLRLARSWSVYERYQGQIDAAIEYWQARAQGVDPSRN